MVTDGYYPRHPTNHGDPQVVVDSFAESREKDLVHLAEEMDHDNEEDRKHLEARYSSVPVCCEDLRITPRMVALW